MNLTAVRQQQKQQCTAVVVHKAIGDVCNGDLSIGVGGVGATNSMEKG